MPTKSSAPLDPLSTQAPFEADVDAAHDVLFALFGEAAHVRRHRGVPVPVRVVVTFGVAELGEYGQGMTRVTTAKFLNREWRARAADLLQWSGGRHRIERVVFDDGVVNEAILHG